MDQNNDDGWSTVPTRRKSVSKKTPPKSSSSRREKTNNKGNEPYRPPRNSERAEKPPKVDTLEKSDSRGRGSREDRRSRTERVEPGSSPKGSSKRRSGSRAGSTEDSRDDVEDSRSSQEMSIPLPKPNHTRPGEGRPNDTKRWVVTKNESNKSAGQTKPNKFAKVSSFAALDDLDDSEGLDESRFGTSPHSSPHSSPQLKARPAIWPCPPAPPEMSEEEEWGLKPLKHQWVFREHRVLPKGGGHDSSYHHAFGYIGECSSIGGFWQVYNNMPKPSDFFAQKGKNRKNLGDRERGESRSVEGFSVFRFGVQPEWEDPKNSTGAELQMSSEDVAECDKWWDYLLLAVLGGVLPCCDELTGLRVIDKSKKGGKNAYRLELWFTAEADHNPLKQGIADVLGSEPKFTLKQHGKQKEVRDAERKAARQPAGGEAQAGRVRDIRALLAKLTPERFERLAPQLRGLLGDGNDTTLEAAVKCIHQCTLQTNVFHSMYADLVDALKTVPGLAAGVIGLCLKELEIRDEENRHDAKNAASFAAELCSRAVLDAPKMMAVVNRFGDGAVEVEVLCTLLTKLHPIKHLQGALDGSFQNLDTIVKSGVLPNRLKFMVQDVLKLNSKPAKPASTSTKGRR